MFWEAITGSYHVFKHGARMEKHTVGASPQRIAALNNFWLRCLQNTLTATVLEMGNFITILGFYGEHVSKYFHVAATCL